MSTTRAAIADPAVRLSIVVALALVAGACVTVVTPPGATPSPTPQPTDELPSGPTGSPTAAPSTATSAPTPTETPTETPTVQPTQTTEPAVPPGTPGVRPHRKAIGDLTFDLGRRSSPCGSTYRTYDPCVVGLRWTDNSSNEDGFRVYVAPALKVKIECDPGGFPCWVASVKCEFGGRLAADLPAGTAQTELGLAPDDFGPPSAFDSVAGACIFLVAYNTAGESPAVEEGFAWGRYG